MDASRQAPATPLLMQGFPPPPAQRVLWSNWLRPPFNRWSLQHLDQLRPTLAVRAGWGTRAAWVAGPDRLADYRFQGAQGEVLELAPHLQDSYTDGFLVLKDDQVLCERYFNGQTPDSRHVMFSVTKSMIGTLAEQALRQGVLSAEALTGDLIPELAGSAFADASVRQLLDMTVGIAYDEVYDDPDSASSRYGYACGFEPAPPGQAQHASLYEYLPSLQKRGEHGAAFHYVTACTEVLAWTLERAGGRSCAALLEDLWRQLGCRRDGFFVADPWGRAVAGAGFAATLQDMGRFGELLAHRGSLPDGRPLLDPAVIDAIAAGGDAALYALDRDFSAWTPGASYRSQWYVFRDGRPALMAGGIHGQYLYVDPAARLVVVKQSSLPRANTEADIDTVRLLRSLGEHFAD